MAANLSKLWLCTARQDLSESQLLTVGIPRGSKSLLKAFSLRCLSSYSEQQTENEPKNNLKTQALKTHTSLPRDFRPFLKSVLDATSYMIFCFRSSKLELKEGKVRGYEDKEKW